jgi:hypothetical protein
MEKKVIGSEISKAVHPKASTGPISAQNANNRKVKPSLNKDPYKASMEKDKARLLELTKQFGNTQIDDEGTQNGNNEQQQPVVNSQQSKQTPAEPTPGK